MEGRRVIGWAARDSSGLLSPYSFTLRETGPEDVVIKVLYCGMDHTDLHQMRNEIHMTNYPLVPGGHEVVGEVVELRSEVKKFRVQDNVGVGCIVGSCGGCLSCKSNIEQYCDNRILTYNGTYKDGRPTQGGFSSLMVVDQKFVVRIPEKLAPEQAAPLLCAGVTAYSPLKQFKGSKKALNAGILGLGGVGHLGVLIAKAMGHHVTVISSSDKKRVEALEHLGADAFLVSTNAAEMERAANSLDYILDTVPAVHPLQSYLPLLKVEGQLILVGVAPQPLHFSSVDLILGKKMISGSFIGSMEETQEILKFWAEKGLTSMVEVVKMDYVNKAFERMERGIGLCWTWLAASWNNIDELSPYFCLQWQFQFLFYKSHWNKTITRHLQWQLHFTIVCFLYNTIILRKIVHVNFLACNSFSRQGMSFVSAVTTYLQTLN